MKPKSPTNKEVHLQLIKTTGAPPGKLSPITEDPRELEEKEEESPETLTHLAHLKYLKLKKHSLHQEVFPTLTLSHQ